MGIEEGKRTVDTCCPYCGRDLSVKLIVYLKEGEKTDLDNLISRYSARR